MWPKVRPVLMNGKIRFAGLLYFILTAKNLGGNVSMSWSRDSLLKFILFLDCECPPRVMVFICLLYIVSPFYILLITLYISLIYHFLKGKILTILKSHFNFDNQMRKIRDEHLYPIWGIFVSDLHMSILITLLLFCNCLLYLSLLYR